jgi:hypothetical protein
VALPEAWASYARLIVTVQGPTATFEIRAADLGVVGEWPTGLPWPLYVLTAWDPGSERPGVEVNRRRQGELEEELRPRAQGMWRAAGHDPVSGGRDEGIIVAGLEADEVLSFARHYGQEAIFEWRPERWSILSCGEEPRLDAGWALSSTEAPTT